MLNEICNGYVQFASALLMSPSPSLSLTKVSFGPRQVVQSLVVVKKKLKRIQRPPCIKLEVRPLKVGDLAASAPPLNVLICVDPRELRAVLVTC